MVICRRRRGLLAGSGLLALSAGWLAKAAHAAELPADRRRRIGWLRVAGAPGVRASLVDALRERGWIDGQNLAIEVRHAGGQRDRAPALAAELIGTSVELICAEAPTAILGAMQATREIPIVMAWWGGPDLVAAGMIASYSRPGGNVSGVDMALSALDAKRLDLLRQAVPGAKKIAVLVHDGRLFEPQLPKVREVAQNAGLSLQTVDVSEFGGAYGGALAAVAQSRCDALLVMSSPVFGRDGKLIADAAARVRIPAILGNSIDPTSALITYGTVAHELDGQVARQVDLLLRGAKVSEMPVELPSRYELVINRSTARALGLAIPQALLLRADRVVD